VNWRAAAEALGENSLSNDPWPVAAKRLLTEREQSFYQSLLSLYPNHKVFIQVALSQLIDVPEDHADRQSIRNRFSQLVADFVLCRTDLSVIAVIELDDRTHERPKRQDADARKNKALADAGIRLVRIPAGPLPSEQYLGTLIDADGMGEKIYPEEHVLTLADDLYAPASSHDSDEAGAVSREFKRVAWKAVALAVLVACGWLFYSYLLPTLMQQAFVSPAKPAHTAVVLPKARVASKPVTATPAVAPPVAELSAESRRLRELEIVALGKQKNLAFAAFYQPPASCEHPIDWSAQVECGNQYIRAKRAFELRWAAEHPNRESGAEVVLDNGSVGRPGR
jgi:hypothetical protein